MKNFIKEMIYILLWVFRFLRSIRHKRGKIVKDTEKEKILIVGNGPSITSFDFFKEEIKDYEIMCVNSFASGHSDFFKIKPRYYCIIDPLNFESNDKWRVIEEETNKFNSELADSLEKVDWKMTLITHVKQRLNLKNSNIEHICVNTNLYEGNYLRDYLYGKNLASYMHYNVLNAAVYYSITAGFRELCIIGAEFDMFKAFEHDKDGNLIYVHRHFTVDGESVIDVNVPIPKGDHYIMCEGYYYALKCFHLYSQYAESMGVKIYNATPASFIDTFDKKVL